MAMRAGRCRGGLAAEQFAAWLMRSRARDLVLPKVKPELKLFGHPRGAKAATSR